MNSTFNPKLLQETANELHLTSPSTVEKDGYVTKILHALADLKFDDFQLVFIGGTSLSKAHHIMQRMSEDIDFKIVPIDSGRSLETKQAKEQLSHIRQEILNHIKENVGLSPKPEQITKGNGNKFTQIFLDYPSIYPQHSVLRKEIKLELTAQPILLEPQNLPIASLMYEVFKEKSGFSEKNILCQSLNETAAEKWGALCRRIADAERQPMNADKTIIRHLYDLHCIESEKGIQQDFEKLAPLIVMRDKNRFKGKSPQFFENTMQELDFGKNALSGNHQWEKNYNDFIKAMVYQKNPPTYQDALKTLDRLHGRAINAIKQSSFFEKIAHNTLSTETITPIQPKSKELTNKQEMVFKDNLKQYQALRERAEKEKNLPAVHAVHHFSEQLTRNKDLMQYAQENYPTTAKNIQILAKEKQDKIKLIQENLTPEKEASFKNTLKNYQRERENFEKDPKNFSAQGKLTTLANKITGDHKLMEYTQYLHPSVAKNIFKLSKIHQNNLQLKRSKEQDYTIEF